MEEIIAKINSLLENNYSSEEEDYPEFSEEGCKPFKIDKKNFHPLTAIDSAKKVAFIDGGNAELIAAPNFSLQLIRVYYTIYRSNKRVSSKKNEFYLLASAVNRADKIGYKIDVFSGASFKLEDLSFDSYDPSIRTGAHRVKISEIGSVVRRFAELKTAAELAAGLGKGDIIVLDGDLRSSITNESYYLDQLYKGALKSKVLVAALAKTSALFTKKGDSLVAVLARISPQLSWYYHPVVEISSDEHKADIFFLKLNKRSRHIFKLELFNGQSYNIMEIAGILAQNSKDPSIPGYPYGLIEADRFARIANQEREYLKTVLAAKLGDNWAKIEEYSNPLNLHSLLDKLG